MYSTNSHFKSCVLFRNNSNYSMNRAVRDFRGTKDYDPNKLQRPRVECLWKPKEFRTPEDEVIFYSRVLNAIFRYHFFLKLITFRTKFFELIFGQLKENSSAKSLSKLAIFSKSCFISSSLT